MSMAEKLCDYIFMIYQGRKVLDGTLETIQDRYGSDTVPFASRAAVVRTRSGVAPSPTSAACKN